MDLDSGNRSPREEGELEDGEICDDDIEENVSVTLQQQGVVRSNLKNIRNNSTSRSTPKSKLKPHNLPSLMGPQPPDFCHLMPYNRGPQLHSPFPPNHRQPGGPSGPERPPGLGLHDDPGPRSSFWERSHSALGRFRHRGIPNGDRGDWGRTGWEDCGGGGRGTGRPPPGRYVSADNHSNRKESPTRKQKPSGRTQVRKPVYGVAKAENGLDESFEDLLSKYRQIQLELECIRKEETMALEPISSPPSAETDSTSISPSEQLPETTSSIPTEAAMEDMLCTVTEKKTFQAFNLKPLRQKLLTPAELDALKKKAEEENKDTEMESERNQTSEAVDCSKEDEKGPIELTSTHKGDEDTATMKIEEKMEKGGEKPKAKASGVGKDKAKGEGEKEGAKREMKESEDSTPGPIKPKGRLEEEEMSEMQLRLLALQSASRKWQQKEQQVMKDSKEKITKASQDKTPGPGATPPCRDRVTTRSASSAAASERAKGRTRSAEKASLRPTFPARERAKPLDKDRSKAAATLTKRERAKPPERAKLGPKPPAERGRPPAKMHPNRKTVSPGSVAKQAFRKQQLRTWKLQQQREQDEKRRQEEEERRKREDEIRKIRDLSNQDEQYNRFMKLVGGKIKAQSKSREREHRKSAGKQGLDTSGNLYQYDNYDEVAMETDSEPNSPALSPVHDPFGAEGPFAAKDLSCIAHIPLMHMDASHFGMEISQRFLSPVPSMPPPPLPPMPPLPDEPEQPPKPPFADEEEEEEMLLRETCLMSMANKRVVVNEEAPSISPPPYLIPQPMGGVQPVPRSNLSTAPLSTVPLARSNKFVRGHHMARPPLVLPRHKAVVVQLNDSDDSDSEPEACSSTQSVFGGLEFMIKEARRTAEASKPKGSEKENDPLRTPESLPHAKKTEYRLLKEEIASREKQRILKDHSPRGVPSPAGSDSEMDGAAKAAAELQLSGAVDRLTTHRNLLQKDETILRHLLQQETKKKESLRAAEVKVARLKEQLLESEKIVNANRTLLKKLQEQVHRIEHRVSIKKSQAIRLERELIQAQSSAGRGLKRRVEPSQMKSAKLQRVDGAARGSERHFAELIAQKQRLQHLEAEYALKIQKLKEAQALHNRAPPVELPSRAPSPSPPLQTQVPPPASPFPLPQPSMHDLTQDKLTLDSEDPAEAEENDAEAAPASVTRGNRRRSFRESGSFTKPKLELGSLPAKETPAKPSKASVGPSGPSELFLGLNVEALKQRYLQQARVGDMLRAELHQSGDSVEKHPLGKVISVDAESLSPQPVRAELKPVPFGPYRSPLLVFKSYRFSPYFRTKEKLSLSSVTYSNAVEPKKCFCRFDLTGTCNDDDCRWQHMRNCTFKGNQLFQDIVSYNLTLIGCSDSSSTEHIGVATEKYIKKVFGANKDRMGMDQKAVLLVSKVNESKRHIPPFTTCKDVRVWRPKPAWQANPGPGEDSGDENADVLLAPVKYDGRSKTSLSALDVCVTPDDKRYFVSEPDDISNLETSVLESPRHAQLWVKLAFRYLSQNETPASECLDAALNTLSRALEDNRDNPEIWCHYLSLFSQRGKREEVQEMCEMAVEHAPHYQVWWNYLNLESSFEGKDFVCDRLLQHLVQVALSGVTERVSFQLMEALLYRVQLSLFTGRMESALALLQNALKSANDRSIADHLTVGHRVLVWLSYIHLTEFDSLPASLYDPANSNPSRLVSQEPFLLPWRTPQDISTPPNILVALFEDAIRQCTDESLPQNERTLACLPLHTNLIALNSLLERFEVGVALCESLLELCPGSCVVRDALADLHIRAGESDKAVSMWMHALAECTHNAEVFYHSCKFLMTQGKSGAIVPLFRGFILSFCEDEQSQKRPVDVLRYILGIPTDEILKGPIITKDLQEQLSHQLPHLYLVHCRWQWLHGDVGETVDAFERALGSVMQLDVLHKLWMDYLLFTSSSLIGGSCNSRELRMFTDLVRRCLATVPSRLEVPFSSAQYWSCFRFHNKVVCHYLSCLPPSQHSLVLERLRYSMPSNIELALRLMQQEWQDGNIEHLKFQARLLSSSVPNCLSSWKIAIAVEKEVKEQPEVRLLSQQALQKLPLCATLWKDRLLFEAAEGGKTDKLRKLIDKCQEVGVSLSEPLTLGSCRMEGEDH